MGRLPKGFARMGMTHLDANGHEKAVVLYAADAGRQLEASCQSPSANALVDFGHMQRQLDCSLPFVGRCKHVQLS